jgi:alpha-D-xyloside xylohydrolase
VDEFNRTGHENSDLREWRELNTRWYQFGAFCPLFRAHGQYPFREPWNIAPEKHPAYESMVYYMRLRYRLMPYLYSLAGMACHNDYTLMRPLVMDFTSDLEARNVSDQFLLGPSLMAAPVYTYGARSRSVYLPEACTWYDFYTGHIAGNGRQDVGAPYERIPLFVPAGSILPVGPEVQYAAEQPNAPLTLYVYTGRDASFTLYDDDGTTYAYERGQYASIPISWNEATATLTIGACQGKYTGMAAKRAFRVVFVSPDSPQAFGSENGAVSVEYEGDSLKFRV